MIKKISFSLLTLIIFIGCSEDIELTNDYVSVDSHNQGVSCLSCHDGVNEILLASGATVYTDVNGVSSDTYASGYTVRLVLSSGTSLDYTSGNGTANSNTTFDLSSYTFTAKVIDANGTVVNSSEVDTHDGGYLDCNSCHTSTGDSTVPGRITSYAQ